MNSATQLEPKSYKLSTKNLFNHFLLVHDFLFKFTKEKAVDAQFLNTQIQINKIVTSATNWGGKFGQLAAFGSVVLVCLRSRSLTTKFVASFIYVYWLNHFYTLGQYFGALIKLPAAYRKVGQYYQKHSLQRPNLLDKFEDLMSRQNQYDDTNQILKQVFPQQFKASPQTNKYLVNEYFQKNKQKYNLANQSDVQASRNLKLKYFDSFLTRYAYHSFTRWLQRLKLFIGISSQ